MLPKIPERVTVDAVYTVAVFVATVPDPPNRPSSCKYSCCLHQGIKAPVVLPGKVGSDARVIGSASLPLFVHYLLDQNVLFKEAST